MESHNLTAVQEKAGETYSMDFRIVFNVIEFS